MQCVSDSSQCKKQVNLWKGIFGFMKKIKAVVCILLILLMAVSIVACGGGSGSSGPSSSGSSGSSGSSSSAGSSGSSGSSSSSGSGSGSSGAGATSSVSLDDYVTVKIGVTGGLLRFFAGLTPDANQIACDLIYDLVFRVDPVTKQVYSDILNDWGWEDETTFVMHMRDDIYFSSGRNANAEDLLFAYTSYGPKERASGWLDAFGILYDDCFARDEYTAVMKTKDYYAEFEYYNIFLHDKEFADRVGWDSLEWYDPPCSGPYYVAEYVEGVSMTLKAKAEDAYWDRARKGPTYVDEFQIINYPDGATCFMNLEIGNIDMCPAQSADYSRYLRQGGDGYEVLLIPIGVTRNFYFGTLNLPEVWLNKRYREAVAYGIDWITLGQSCLEDRFVQAYGICASNSPDFLDTGWDKLPYDPDLSKQIMQELGHGPDNMLKLAAVGGTTTQSEYEMLQFYLKAMYIDLSIEFLDTAASLERQSKIGPGIVDLGFTQTRRGSAASMFRESIKYTGMKNPTLSYVNDDRFQDLFQQVTSEFNVAARREAMRELQRYNREELFIIPMNEAAQAYAYRTDKLRAEHILNNFSSDSIIQVSRMGFLSAWE